MKKMSSFLGGKLSRAERPTSNKLSYHSICHFFRPTRDIGVVWMIRAGDHPRGQKSKSSINRLRRHVGARGLFLLPRLRFSRATCIFINIIIYFYLFATERGYMLQSRFVFIVIVSSSSSSRIGGSIV